MNIELVVREFMEDESVKPWLIKIKGLCRHLKMSRGENGISLLGITCYAIVQVDGKYVMLEMLLGA